MTGIHKKPAELQLLERVGPVTNMARLFRDAAAFNQTISPWDVSAVKDMSYMCSGTKEFNQNINNSCWDVSAVTPTDFMFDLAASFDQNINNSWDVSAGNEHGKHVSWRQKFQSEHPLVERVSRPYHDDNV
jgi:hypothetical protein